MRLLLIADTHVPKRARDLPAQVWDEVARADVVVHAGDWIAPELVDELKARSVRLVGCWGNNDGPEVRSRLPERADVTLAGLLALGHPVHQPTRLRLLNPGSPTDRRRQPFCTYLTASIDDGQLTDVVLHRLDK